jgi:hypothetical protein
MKSDLQRLKTMNKEGRFYKDSKLQSYWLKLTGKVTDFAKDIKDLVSRERRDVWAVAVILTVAIISIIQYLTQG